MISAFIGFDKDESQTAYVLAHSLHRNSSIPLAITFLNRETLRGIFTRERGSLESTDFSISRFLVPYLCNYSGHAIFMDCDILCRDDIAKLWAWRDDVPVRVVKNNHQPTEETKFLDNIQTKYQKKNWSSVMLFNNEKCKSLTLDYVNIAPGLDLHQFKWLKDDEIGDLPKQWNHLVDYEKFDPKASMVHFTKGGPYFDEYKNCDYHQDWNVSNVDMNYIRKRGQDK